ncbi:TetR/AcrR family transcriptional regulator [Phytoactinopolyspora halophila]|uniref:TetR/AcrR family transcriptional regulator n=1 Tax=Phytoactinopolyspora halophila TaxID=1981511 RepID=UPI0013140663|nr:TetR/AcrR family transcriptional regulator [Phytoactinopolyspora halophila]
MSTRERILDAAAEIMRTDGIARATTKEIAQRAGFSEAALYKHFSDKTEIFMAVLGERVPGLAAVLDRLRSAAGTTDVRDTLEQVTRTAIEFYDRTFPMAVGMFHERRLLETYREGTQHHGGGPETVNRALSEYLHAEQDLGRLRANVEPEALASLLMGACLQQAFFRHFYGRPEPADADDRASQLVDAVLHGAVLPSAHGARY